MGRNLVGVTLKGGKTVGSAILPGQLQFKPGILGRVHTFTETKFVPIFRERIVAAVRQNV